MDVEFSINVADLVHALQVERGLTVLSISSNQTKEITKKLRNARTRTDTAIHIVISWFKDHKETTFRSRIASKRTCVDFHRATVGYGGNSTITEEIKFYTDIIEDSLQWLFDSFTQNFPDNIIFDLLGYHMFLTAKDKTGIERALGGSFFAVGHFNTTELLWFAEKYMTGKEKV